MIARLVTGQAKDATGNAEGSPWQGVALTWRKEVRARGAANTGLQKRDTRQDRARAIASLTSAASWGR